MLNEDYLNFASHLRHYFKKDGLTYFFICYNSILFLRVGLRYLFLVFNICYYQKLKDSNIVLAKIF